MSGDRCPLCGGARVAPLVTGQRFGVSTPVSVCETCAFAFRFPRPAASELSHFYLHDYREMYSAATEPTPEFVEDQRSRGADILGRLLAAGLAEGGVVLDVGCGAGGTLLPFRERGFGAVGSEVGSFGQWGAEHLGLDIHANELEQLPEEIAELDAVLAVFVLEHLLDPMQSMIEMRRRLRAGGLLYLEVPDLRCIYGPIDEYFHLAHLNYFSLPTLRYALASAGLEVVASSSELGYACWTISTPAVEPDRSAAPPRPAETAQVVRRRLRRQRLQWWVDRRVRGSADWILGASTRLGRLVGAEALGDRVRARLKRLWRG